MRIVILLALLLPVSVFGADAHSESPASPEKANTPGPQTPGVASPPETGEPALHAIEDRQLEKLMDQLNELVFKQMHGQLEAGREEHRDLKELAATAAKLADAVDAILKNLPKLNLKHDEQASFKALAGKLRNHAKAMEAQAKANQIELLRSTMDEITLTCSACHSLFRKTPSLMERCRNPKHTC